MEFTDAPVFSRSRSDPKMKLDALMFLKTVVNDFQLVATQILAEHATQTVEALRTLAKVVRFFFFLFAIILTRTTIRLFLLQSCFQVPLRDAVSQRCWCRSLNSSFVIKSPRASFASSHTQVILPYRYHHIFICLLSI